VQSTAIEQGTTKQAACQQRKKTACFDLCRRRWVLVKNQEALAAQQRNAYSLVPLHSTMLLRNGFNQIFPKKYEIENESTK